MKDLSNNRYTQNGQSALPDDQTSSLYPPNSAPGFARTINPTVVNKGAPSPIINTRMITSSFYSDPQARVMLGENLRRNYLTIQNNGGVNIHVGFGSIPDLFGNNSLILPPNTGIAFDTGYVPNNDVYIISASLCLVSVIEGIQK